MRKDVKNSDTLIVIVTYNACKNNWITKCLNSIDASAKKCDIIAIDNGSTDETCKIIAENFPKVILIKNIENLGFGMANNVGLSYAVQNNYKYAFLLNQDAFVLPDTIDLLIGAASKNPEFGLVSPMHLSGDGESLDAEFSREIMHKYCPYLISDLILKKEMDKIYEADFICAAAWLIPADTLRIVGGFNPSFFHYGEDNNYVHRLIYKNLKIGVYPCAKILHDREHRAPGNFDSKEYISRRNYLINIANPQDNLSTKDLTKHLTMSLLKACLKMDTAEIKQIKEEIIFFKKQRTDLEKNTEISKDGDYAFLNIGGAEF